jgi:hypothetical protein
MRATSIDSASGRLVLSSWRSKFFRDSSTGRRLSPRVSGVNWYYLRRNRVAARKHFPQIGRRLLPLPPAPGRRADKADDHDYTTEAVERARQCEGERYSLLMAEAATAAPSTAMANAKTSRSFFTANSPDSIPAICGSSNLGRA